MKSSATSTIRLADDLAALVNHIHRRCAADMLQLVGSLELSISQVKALHLLDLTGPRALGELAAEMHLSPAATGRAVDDLHRMGLVERSEDASDRRVRRVRISGEGEALLGRIAESRLAVMRELVSGVDPAQQAALSEALRPVLAHAATLDVRPHAAPGEKVPA
jgi:DNA-binding MarR family transcriptional regulator